MKLTKTDFKNMLKECMRELIQEGAFDDLMTEGRSARSYSLPNGKAAVLLQGAKGKTKSAANPKAAIQAEQVRSRIRNEVGYGELIEDEENNLARVNDMISENLQRVVESTAQSMSRGDSKTANAYASILADTAINTLPGLMSGEGSGMGLQKQQALQESVNSEQLEELAFGGDMTRWAKVAFAGRDKQ